MAQHMQYLSEHIMTLAHCVGWLSACAHLQAIKHLHPSPAYTHHDTVQVHDKCMRHSALMQETHMASVSCQGVLACRPSSTQPSQPPADTRIAPTSAPCGTSSAPALRRSLRQHPSVWFPVPLPWSCTRSHIYFDAGHFTYTSCLASTAPCA